MQALLLLVVFLFPVQSKEFEQFEFERSVELSNEVLLGHPRSMEVAENGDMLVYDQRLSTVALFDVEGNLIKSLDPTPCHPGFNMMPNGAYFAGNRIFMTNTGPWGYRFDRRGECVGPIDDTFLPEALMAGTASGDLWGFYARDQKLVRMDSLGRSILSVPTPHSEFPNLQSRWSTGGLIVSGEDVYFASPIHYRIHHYNIDGQKLEAIGEEPSGFSRPPRDLPERLSREMLSGLGDVMGAASTTYRLDLLDDGLLMIQFRNPGEPYRVRVYTTDGRLLIDEVLPELASPFIFAKNGLAYRFVTPDLEDPDAVPVNPSIEVYRYTGPRE